MKTAEQILDLLDRRRDKRGTVLGQMERIKQAYNGDLVYPLPELDADEKQMVANLVQSGIDQTAMRIASTTPNLFYPPSRSGKAAADRARKKRDVNLGWWERNRYNLKSRRRARWLLGYATAPVYVGPGGDREPLWRLVNPLSCFPAPSLDPDDLVPPDCISVYTRSRAWLTRAYPEAMARLRKGAEIVYEVIEYVDSEETVWVVRGAKPDPNAAPHSDGSSAVETLVRTPNKANRPLVVVPGRITLDRPMGQYDGAIGMMHTKSMMMALAVIAQKRAIFPESWVYTQQGSPNIVQDSEPMSGQVGIIENGQITYVKPEASMFTTNMLDRLEYEMRQDSATPSQYGGNNPTNVRTGRAGAQLLEAVIDFPIQEAQEVLEASAEEENRIAIAVAKAYQHQPVSMYVKGRGEVTYLPRDTFDTDVHEVHYPLPGADARGMEIAVGQKIGMGTMSKQTAMEIDPSVRDVESELDRIRSEKVDDAFMASIQTLAQNPEGPWQPEDFARFTELVRSDRKEPYEAAQTVITEVKERQLAQAQAQAAEVEQMPGLAQPGQPGAPVPAIGEPEPALGNLSRALANLRLPQMRVPGEQAVA